eukprot:SM000299S10846  [mRNA]  locus=s299:22066:23765:- [translate_table: standard]
MLPWVRSAAMPQCLPPAAAATVQRHLSSALVRSSTASAAEGLAATPTRCKGSPAPAGRAGAGVPVPAPRQCSALASSSQPAAEVAQPAAQAATVYQPGLLDDIFLALFRRKMVAEVGWDSGRPGYDGLVDVARRLLAKHRSRLDTEEATVRILRSLFPPALLPLFRLLIARLGDGKPAAWLTARVTQATCQWLMGPCHMTTVEWPDGRQLSSGVKVEKCRYLEESKCTGICIHTCKLPTQEFISRDMGIALSMEPNFEDYSCEFKFGIPARPRDLDEDLKKPCLHDCPIAILSNSSPSFPFTPCPQLNVTQ